MKKISVCDFTLKALCGENTAGLLFREKTAIAQCINKIGADKAELPPVRRAKEDAIICKTIAAIMNCELALPAGCDEKSIDTAWECIRSAKKPCLQIALPVSTAQMEYGFRMKEPAMLENIAKLVSLAKQKCPDVEFIAQDATRADRGFLLKSCLTAAENGATAITVCDDAGISLPEDIAELVKAVKEACPLPLSVSLADNISMAAASAAAAIKAGADGIKTAMAGENVLLTEKFAAMMKTVGAKLGAQTSLNLTELSRDIHSVMTGIDHTAQAGNTAVSAQNDIFLDSQSTLTEVCEAVRVLGYDLSDEDNGKVHKALMQVCSRKNSVGAKELEALIATNAMQAPSAYHLVSFSATCSSNGSSMAQVTLDKGGDVLGGVALGDGPIDSAFRAIEQCIGYHYELDAFEIQAVTEGKEALGSTLVRLRNNGKLYSGTGLSTDIVAAGVRAYINALNKIAAEEN